MSDLQQTIGPKQRRVELNWVVVTTTTNETDIDDSTATEIDERPHRPPAETTLKIQDMFFEVYYTTPDTTEAALGDLTLRWGDRRLHTSHAVNPTSAAPYSYIIPIPTDGMELKGDGTKELHATCIPAVTDSITWRICIFAYEYRRP